jgi:hypothetical protein
VAKRQLRSERDPRSRFFVVGCCGPATVAGVAMFMAASRKGRMVRRRKQMRAGALSLSTHLTDQQ